MLAGLVINLIASILISYGRIFRSKRTIEKESITDGHENVHEEKHRLIETRVAQVGAILLAIGFAIQIWELPVIVDLRSICKDYFVFTISIPRPCICSSFL
jgi:hypothetical protein